MQVGLHLQELRLPLNGRGSDDISLRKLSEAMDINLQHPNGDRKGGKDLMEALVSALLSEVPVLGNLHPSFVDASLKFQIVKHCEIEGENGISIHFCYVICLAVIERNNLHFFFESWCCFRPDMLRLDDFGQIIRLNHACSHICCVFSSLCFVFSLCFFSVFSLCVSSLCFLSVFSRCVFSLCRSSVFSVCVFSLCFLSLCVICLCFLSSFAFYRTTKNDTFRSIDVDIMLLWSGIAGQQLFTKSCC